MSGVLRLFSSHGESDFLPLSLTIPAWVFQMPKRQWPLSQKRDGQGGKSRAEIRPQVLPLLRMARKNRSTAGVCGKERASPHTPPAARPSTDVAPISMGAGESRLKQQRQEYALRRSEMRRKAAAPLQDVRRSTTPTGVVEGGCLRRPP